MELLESIKDNYFLSLVEQVICEKSKVFVASTDSTWSDFVVDNMKMNYPDSHVHALDKMLASEGYKFEVINLYQEQKAQAGKKKAKRSIGEEFDSAIDDQVGGEDDFDEKWRWMWE